MFAVRSPASAGRVVLATIAAVGIKYYLRGKFAHHTHSAREKEGEGDMFPSESHHWHIRERSASGWNLEQS